MAGGSGGGRKRKTRFYVVQRTENCGELYGLVGRSGERMELVLVIVTDAYITRLTARKA